MANDEIVTKALERKQTALSEHDSKLLMAKYDIPVAPEKLVGSADEAVEAAKEIGYPVVLKACGPEISHKTERNLVVVGLKTKTEVSKAYAQIMKNLGDTPSEGVLVQAMVPGERELVIGLVRDPQFGPCVMFGLGGIFTEVLKDVSFRVAPLTEADALEMMDEIRARKILGRVRGMPEADKTALAQLLVKTGQIGLDSPEMREIDMNPVMLDGADPVVVDALVILK